MALFIADNKRNDTLVPDGEYKARIEKVFLSNEGKNVVFRCKILTDGFDNTTVAGFCAPHWRASNRTTANLRQWCINLGVNVVSGQEESINIEDLAGKECRVIVQQYTNKMGEERCKVSNILPLERKLNTQPKIQPKPAGLHIPSSNPAPTQQQQPAPVQAAAVVEQTPTTTQTVAAAPAAASETQKVDEDDLW